MPLDLARAAAAETADAVRRGDLTALEAADAAIARIEARDGPVNAVVVRDFDRAREAARRLDADRRPDDPRPLLGVPMTLKESHDVAGLPSTWGFGAHAQAVAQRDGAVAARLKAAGAVILGKTNVPVALADWQSENPIHGRTNNPHDLTRSPGGSSGGAAAALAAGMVPLEVGSDIGGSIRVPAHFCGVFGHKPTWGVIPQRGQTFPGTDSPDLPLAVLGPMARCAQDLALALDVLAGPEAPSPWRLDLPAPRAKRLSDQRVLVLDQHPEAATDAAIRRALGALADALSREGARVERASPRLPDLSALHADYRRMLLCVLGRGQPGAKTIDAYAWMDLLDRQMRATRAWSALFEDFDVVLAPVLGAVAFPHEPEPDWSKRTLLIDGEPTPYADQLAWPGLALFPGLPAAAVPVAETEAGLPVGIQAVAAPWADRTAIAFAGALEAAGLAAARLAEPRPEPA